MLNPGGIIDTSIAIDTAYKIGRRVGCELAFTSNQLAECLRNVDEYELILAMDTVLLKLKPTVDGEFITAPPAKLVEEGLFKQASILVGTTLNDGVLGTVKTYPDQIFKRSPFSDRDDFRERLQKAYKFVNPLILDAMEQQYIDWSMADDPDANYFYTYMDIETDETFLCPQDAVSRKYAEGTNDVFRYSFTHEPSASVWPPVPVWKGVAHIDDVPFVFGSAFLPEFADVEVPQEEIDLSVDMMTYFTNFAKTGKSQLWRKRKL
ncbi:Acetylcholinesterase [Holothuria leucospilota]|uniref:Acetylcholinesterase n=1 Tax=Holothuria leucospilota TaxID=206669 RepID=A0A9Q1C2K1_HOLLE|nr:Acetylcholinesterase [Holothuria leucospilota]